MATNSFEVSVIFTQSDNDEKVSFKADGQRFKTADKTIKFVSNAKYKIKVITKPATEF
jgi:hypothetical protein